MLGSRAETDVSLGKAVTERVKLRIVKTVAKVEVYILAFGRGGELEIENIPRPSDSIVKYGAVEDVI